MRAERGKAYLNKEDYQNVCNALSIEPVSIMDTEYKFYYEGYGQVIDFLIENMGLQAVLNSLNVYKNTLHKWKSGCWMPQFNQRKTLIKLYNELVCKK